MQNPVTLGDHIDDKTLILDIKLILDSNKIIEAKDAALKDKDAEIIRLRALLPQ